MMNTLKTHMALGLLLLCWLAMSACAASAPPKAAPAAEQMGRLPHAININPPGGAVMLSGNTQAGDALGEMLLPRVGSGGSILVATLVDMENFDKTSAFGRSSMQQIGSRLSQHGFKVLEPRLAADLRFEKRQGEFMLTRDSRKLLAARYDAHAILVGTYSESKDKVFVSVRVVRLGDNAILGAYEYYLPKNSDVEVLIGAPQGPVGRSLWSRYAAREPAFASPR